MATGRTAARSLLPNRVRKLPHKLRICFRLKTSCSSRDPLAEALIAERLKQQPYAPYIMAQQIYAQEQALLSLQQRLQEVQGELEQAKAARPPSGGFLSGIFGGGQGAAPPPPQARPGGPWSQQAGYGAPPPPGYGAPPPQAGPWGGQAAAPAGGGFLASAATTALGVAGGMMIANALGNAFSNHGGSNQSLAGMDTSSIAPTPGSSYVDPDINRGSDAPVHQAAYDPGDTGNYDSGSFDSGGYDSSDA